MNRSIRQITESLTDLLPEDQEYYKLSNLRSWGYPGFIVNRIRVELERNLAESMRLPQTDWANMQSETVQAIWQQFINAIRNEAWLPASYASTVIETAVGDVMEILVEPRKRIPDVVFAADKELSAEELEKRVDVLVVYPHFANLLPRYMKKKNLDTITKERCAEIVAKADKKITARYTPLNWAQLLEPLFQLYHEQIDSSLLRLFFEDKNMPRIARKFDFMDEPVNRAKLIETLSSPDSLNMMGYEDDQSELFEEEEPKNFERSLESGISESKESEETPVKEKESAKSLEIEKEGLEKDDDDSGPDVSAQNGRQTIVVADDEDAESETEQQSQETESSLNTIFSQDSEESTSEPEEENEPVSSLNNDFEEDGEESESEFNREDRETENHEEEQSETKKQERKEIKDYSEEPREFQLTSEPEEDSTEPMVDFSEEVTKETPMWQRFMGEEELQEEDAATGNEQKEYEKDKEPAPAEPDQEEPIFDLTDSEEPEEGEVERLHQRLQAEKNYFIEQIFAGSERAYEEAVYDIAGKRDWRSASRYLEKEVFQRNMVDMYSEPAIDLTDRLHTYFMNRRDS